MSEQTNHSEILKKLKDIEDNQKIMSEILTPMNDSYQAALRIGKWASTLLVFISILVGVILAFKDLFTKK